MCRFGDFELGKWWFKVFVSDVGFLWVVRGLWGFGDYGLVFWKKGVGFVCIFIVEELGGGDWFWWKWDLLCWS